MNINYSEGWLPSSEIMTYMNNAAEFILKNEGIDPEYVEISVTFVDEDEIKSLNERHRNIGEVTDVLSFPQYENPGAIKEELNDTYIRAEHDNILVTLGDVVICREKIQEQAEYMGHSFERELLYLFTHSVLHLLAYDHVEPEDYLKMREAESKTMDEIGLGRTKRDN